MAFNPLADNAAARKVVYTLFWLVGLALGALTAAYGATDGAAPDFLGAALAVYAFLGGAVGYQAAANTPAADNA